MLTRRNRQIIAIAVALFLVMQTLIFASIPRDMDSEPVNVVIRSGTSISCIAQLLKDEGVIYSSNLFLLFSLFSQGKMIAGEYELKKSMSTIDIIRKLRRGERNIYILRIVEGQNIYNIADSLENARIMNRDVFLNLVKDQEYLTRLNIKADSLEGFFAPDTYYYSKEVDADRFLEQIIQRTIRIFDGEDVKKMMEPLRLDMYQILTLASMIEKETGCKEEKPIVSSVFHNRLAKGMSLDCDPTVLYGTSAFRAPIRKIDLKTYTPYNTYTFKGLPKGPICSPDKNSIMAALNPAQTEYLYFVSTNDGAHVFSKDMKMHNRYVTTYQRSKNSKKP